MQKLINKPFKQTLEVILQTIKTLVHIKQTLNLVFFFSNVDFLLLKTSKF